MGAGGGQLTDDRGLVEAPVTGRLTARVVAPRVAIPARQDGTGRQEGPRRRKTHTHAEVKINQHGG